MDVSFLSRALTYNHVLSLCRVPKVNSIRQWSCLGGLHDMQQWLTQLLTCAGG
jgi:hypothetical protein